MLNTKKLHAYDLVIETTKYFMRWQGIKKVDVANYNFKVSQYLEPYLE